MKNGNYCEVQSIIRTVGVGSIFLLCREIIVDSSLSNTTYIHKCTIPPNSENLLVFSSSDVDSVSVFIQADQMVYLCDIPNPYERE